MKYMAFRFPYAMAATALLSGAPASGRDQPAAADRPVSHPFLGSAMHAEIRDPATHVDVGVPLHLVPSSDADLAVFSDRPARVAKQVRCGPPAQLHLRRTA
jgi:hypothetical protein